MLKIGITGGIGSGKTTVCRLFEVFGIPVYYADARAKQLMVEDKNLVQQIKTIFGEKAYLEDGELNRKHIATIAFGDKSKLDLLNAVVHPAVGKDTLKWFQEQKDVPFALQEAALMFETGSYKKFDYVITVTTPLDLRIQRVMNRDNTTKEEVEARIKSQMDEQEKVKRSDYVIYNDSEHSLIQQVFELYQKLNTKESFL